MRSYAQIIRDTIGECSSLALDDYNDRQTLEYELCKALGIPMMCHCNGRPIVKPAQGIPGYFVDCDNCSDEGTAIHHERMTAAIEEWNEREYDRKLKEDD